jgi:autotransporter-associated beta strand protein
MSSHNLLIRRAIASLLPAAFAGQAYANCTVPQGTLTNINPGVMAVCTGVSANQTLGSTNTAASVLVSSGSLDNSVVDLAGDQSSFTAVGGTSLNNTSVTVRGPQGQIYLSDGANVVAAAGSLVMGGVGAPTSGMFYVDANVSAIANVNNNEYLLTGLGGDQYFVVSRNLTSATGRFISAGDGDDVIEIQSSAWLNGSVSTGSILGGAGLDVLHFAEGVLPAAGHALDVNSTGVERLLVTTDLSLRGNHEFDFVRLQTGTTLSVSSVASLGIGSGQIELFPDSTLEVDLANGVPSNISQRFFGSGTLRFTGLGLATLTGDNSAFSGTVHLAQSSNGIEVSDAGQVGSGTLLVEGQLQLVGGADYLLQNRISGDGNVNMEGTGTVTLGTQNDGYSGALTVTRGTVVAAGSWSTGSGQLSIETDGRLIIDAGNQDVDLVNELYGDGAIIKRGSGTTSLTGRSNFQGTSRIEDGALRVSAFEQLGPATVDVSANGALILAYSDPASLLVNSFMTGEGQFIKEGSGSVVVDSANSYSGGTVIREGRIGLNIGDGLGTGDIQVDSGAILGLGGVQLDNDVTGDGQIIKTASNRATLTGNNTGFSGELRLLDGAVYVQDVMSLGTGTVSLDAGTQLEIHNASSQDLVSTLYGEGDVIKSGGGRLAIMGGTNPFLGDLNILEGELQIDGSGSSGFGNIDLAANTTLHLHNERGRSLDNTISGEGSVVKTGAGFMSVDLGGQYSGGTDIQQGGLRVTDLAALGTGGITTAADAFLVLNHDDATPMVVNSIMAGAGTFVKEGAGTVVVSSGNSYTGGTVIEAGRLGLNTGDALGTGVIQVNADAILGIGEISLANNLAGEGEIIKTAGGTATLTGNNSAFTGDLLIQQGTVSADAMPALGSGSINVANGATLRVNTATTVEFAPALGGAGTLVKQGAGRLEFADAFTVGALDVTAGRVRLNANGTTNATVATGAALDGTGRLIGNLVNNGTVAPGNSIGTLTVEGNYVQNAGAVLEVEFDAAGNIDLLNVTGTAALNGTLRFSSLGGAEGTGGTFLTAAGGVSGTFANVETVGAQLPLTVIYQPGSAQMSPSVVSARPSTFNAQWLAGAETALGYLERVSDAYGWAGADHVWFQGFSARGERDAAGASLGFEHDAQGFAAGSVWSLANNFELGASAGWASGDIALDAGGGGGEQDSLLGSLSLRYVGTRFELGAGVMTGKIDQTTRRNVSFSGAASSVTGETESSLFGGYLQAGATLGKAAGWTFDATGRASLVRQAQDAYREQGTNPLRLDVSAASASSLELHALFSASRKFGGNDGVALRFDLGARHLALQGSREIDVAFAGSNSVVTVQGDDRSTTQALLGTHLSYALTKRLLLSAGYAGQLGGNDHHEARLGVSLGF